jgi:predicted  nucleic acid-binding Zn-ribbon protein
MNELYSSLLQLQELDQQIATAEAKVEAFTRKFDEARSPVTGLERDIGTATNKLDELRFQQRKLDTGVENKRTKLRQFQERAEKRAMRNEAGTKAEMDLIRRAVDAEVEEAGDVGEQVKRQDMKLDDLRKALERANEDISPKVAELESERAEAQTELQQLLDKRNAITAPLDKPALRLYERVRLGKKRNALAPMTADGACGSCYNVLPVQEQTEVRNGNGLHRCEACGVILYATD